MWLDKSDSKDDPGFLRAYKKFHRLVGVKVALNCCKLYIMLLNKWLAGHYSVYIWYLRVVVLGCNTTLP